MTDIDPGQISNFYNEASELINHLDKEEEEEHEGLKLQKQGEAELKDALSQLQKMHDNGNPVIEILAVFNQLDVEKMTHGQSHEVIQKQVIDNPKFSITSVDGVRRNLQEIQDIFNEIEDGLRQIQRGDEMIEDAGADAQTQHTNIQDLERFVTGLEEGLQSYTHWEEG